MRQGFTLAELLIALAILGVIATFTIPKVLQNQQDSRNKALAKEAAGAIAAAYDAYRSQKVPATSMNAVDLVPYFNYLKLSVSGTDRIDNYSTSGSFGCDSGPCMYLHSGGILMPANWANFNGTTTTNCIEFVFDPDGKNNNQQSVGLVLTYNGRVTTVNGAKGMVNSNGPYACTTCDPTWFSWN